MRWCICYLEREEQIAFLRKAKEALDNKIGKYSRTNGPSSYIIVFDNIDDIVERKKKLNVDNQDVQTEDYYE